MIGSAVVGYQERRVKLMAKRAGPHLRPGERIQTGFLAETGSWMRFNLRIWTFVATDRALLVLGNGLAVRLPRETPLGTPAGLYHWITLDDLTFRVHRQWYPEINTANEALRGTQTPDPPESGRP